MNPRLKALNLMNSADGIARPIVGDFTQGLSAPDFSMEGPTPGVKSVFCPAATAECILYNAKMSDKGCFEFWFKPNGWNVTNGQMGGSRSAQSVLICYNAANLYEGTHILYYLPVLGLWWDYADPAGGYYQMETTVPEADLVADVWQHFALSWDRTKDPNRMIFKDGKKVAETNNAVFSIFTDNPATEPIGNYNGGPGIGAEGWLFGFKHWDFMKTNFDDRFNFRAGIGDQKLIV